MERCGSRRSERAESRNWKFQGGIQRRAILRGGLVQVKGREIPERVGHINHERVEPGIMTDGVVVREVIEAEASFDGPVVADRKVESRGEIDAQISATRIGGGNVNIIEPPLTSK
jgi:hypothetical protein